MPDPFLVGDPMYGPFRCYVCGGTFNRDAWERAKRGPWWRQVFTPMRKRAHAECRA